MADDTYVVTRSILIDAPPERVRELLVDFHAWRQWSPWEDLDPEMERSYAGPDRGKGATYAWSGNRKAGAGTMEITAVNDREVEIGLVFTRPFKATNSTAFRLEPGDAGGTEVTWSMTGRRTVMTRIMEVFRSMDAMMGPDFERGLGRLKGVAEDA